MDKFKLIVVFFILFTACNKGKYSTKNMANNDKHITLPLILILKI